MRCRNSVGRKLEAVCACKVMGGTRMPAVVAERKTATRGDAFFGLPIVLAVYSQSFRLVHVFRFICVDLAHDLGAECCRDHRREPLLAATGRSHAILGR